MPFMDCICYKRELPNLGNSFSLRYAFVYLISACCDVCRGVSKHKDDEDVDRILCFKPRLLSFKHNIFLIDGQFCRWRKYIFCFRM